MTCSPADPAPDSPAPGSRAPDVALVVAELLGELRPDLPWPVAVSLAVEALDNAADAVLDAEWARQRRAMAPAALAAAQARRWIPYARRRARQLAAARPRPGDYPGGPVPWTPTNPRPHSYAREDAA